MKKLPALFLVLLSPVFAFAQNKINAEEIIRKIDNKETVRYENVEIVGDLDFLAVKEVTKNRKDSNGDQEAYDYHIRASVSFKNCVFSESPKANTAYSMSKRLVYATRNG
jgi:hypothetical protein